MPETVNTKEEIFVRLKAFLVELFDLPEDNIVMEADLAEDLDLDSIDAVDLMVKVQELTGVRISAEEFKSVRTVSDVVDRVHDLINKSAA
ncbi:acyl carrier protein [Minwuia sp.]|uniref:acyl carrier protein n=1 Tax=Minwuia sp. TaxID=2493630 RepID=UPI003A90C8E4